MQAILSTRTEIRKYGGIGIYTYYEEGLKSIQAFISQVANSINGVQFLENELGFVIGGYTDIVVSLNKKGELIIYSDTDKSFSINTEGELIFEEEI